MKGISSIAAGIEVALIAVAVAVLAGVCGSGRWISALGGVVVMVALGFPTLLLLKWGRERSHKTFMTTLGVAFLGKLATVGGVLLVVFTVTSLRQLEFVLGLMVGWVVSFAVQAFCLKSTTKLGSGHA